MAVTTGRVCWRPRGFLSPSLHRQHIATLRHDRIDAPCVLDGPINSESSKGYVEHFLVPTLMPGDIVIRTISAATRAMRCAGPFAPWARGSLPAALQF